MLHNNKTGFIRNNRSYFILVAVTLLLSGCSFSKPVNTTPAEETEPVENNEPEIEPETIEDEPIADVPNEDTMPIEPGLYNRTYLTEADGYYKYSLLDDDLIRSYDELYASAFNEVVESYKEIVSYQNQSYDFSKPASVTNLAFKETPNTTFINVGSYFEMDYGFNLNNVGYTYVDLDSDGSFELIFGVISKVPDEEIPYDYFERAYTLIDNKPVRFIEGGSRVLFWLGNDGYTYENGSSGAANSGIWKLTFNSSNIDSNWDGWEKTGFSNEAFLGVWDSYIHIDHQFDDIDSEANLSENQITIDEFQSLSYEWDSRRIAIDWLRLSDYLANNKLL